MHAVREAFEMARLDAGAIDRAIGLAEDFLAANADYPVVVAYLGSLRAMKAGASLLPWVKLKHANVASALLESAYVRRFETGAPASQPDAYPGELEIALLRGVAYANFPEFLGKAEAARASLAEAMENPAFPMVPRHYRALAHVHLAVICHRVGEEAQARRHLEEAIEMDASTARPIWASYARGITPDTLAAADSESEGAVIPSP